MLQNGELRIFRAAATSRMPRLFDSAADYAGVGFQSFATGTDKNGERRRLTRGPRCGLLVEFLTLDESTFQDRPCLLLDHKFLGPSMSILIVRRDLFLTPRPVCGDSSGCRLTAMQQFELVILSWKNENIDQTGVCPERFTFIGAFLVYRSNLVRKVGQ